MRRFGSSVPSRRRLGSAAATAFLAAAVILAIGSWQLHRSRSEILDHASDEVRVLSHALAQHAARTIEAVDLTLEDVADHAQREGTGADDLTAFVRQRASRLDQVRNLAVVRADGSWRASALAAPATVTSAGRAYFAWHRAHDDTTLHIDETILSLTTGKTSIPLSRRLNNPDGSFGGLIIATLAPDYLNAFYKQVRSGERGTVSVWLEDGRLLVRYPAVADPSRALTAAAAATAAAFFKSTAGSSRAVSPFDGVDRLFAFEHLDGLPVVVSASVSIEDALAGWRYDALSEGAVIGVAALLLVALGCGLDAHQRRIAVLLATSQATDKRYRMLADSTRDMITHMALDGTRLYVSPASRELLGYRPEALVGTNPKNTVHPEDEAQLRSVLDGLVTGREENATNINRLRHRDGRWIWVEASLRLLRDSAGQPSSIVAAVRDVTERQRTAEHLERARMAAEHATQLKTDFVANMSHELRTPLTGILGIHDMLEQDATLGPAQKRYVSMARDAGRSLLAIVNDVLDFSKIEAGELTVERVPFDLRVLVEACQHLASEQANGKPLTVQAHVEDAACILLGDPTRLRQIVLNLLTNAVKFTDRGTVTIAASYRRELGRLRIDVSDTGIGIAPEKIPLLFKRFSQADSSTTRKYGGTGLGLAISKRLVELMGGDLGVHSVVGRGTTFWIEIPLTEGLEATGLAANDPPAMASPRRILLAEDNIVNQEIISAVLEQRGHRVTIVENGAAATAAVVGTSDFDVILMDVQMPVMDGLSATRAIRAAEAKAGRPPVPIIGLTANAMIVDIQRCLDVGMDAHVAKPIEWAEMLSTIDAVVAARPTAMVD